MLSTSLIQGLDSESAVPQCGLCWSSRGSRKKPNPWELDHVANRLSHLISHIQGLDSGCVIPCRTMAISWKFAWQPEIAEPLRGRPTLTNGPQTVSTPPWSSLHIYDWTATVQCCDLVPSLLTQSVATVLLVPVLCTWKSQNLSLDAVYCELQTPPIKTNE